MKYKVGDRVRVRADLRYGQKRGCFQVTSKIERMAGGVIEIKNVRIAPNGRPAYTSETPHIPWWTDEMFEPVNKSYNRDDIVKEMDNQNENNIKPSHYRKGESDLYEAFSKIYPMNEFRAGMQMIAMRYMFRDKNNRVEDIDKAIYTLERLKEVEE